MTRTDAHDVPRPAAQLHLGVFFQGVNHWTIWTEPDSGSQIAPESYREVAQTAERGLFDAFFLGEGLRLREINGLVHDLDIAGRPEAITQLAALAAVTTHIGLVSTSNTTAQLASGSFSWLVSYDSTNPAQRDIPASCQETSALTISNGCTVSSP